ncbi:MAG: hypothetical protein K9J12_13935 [Melioribacteraceae bacterium]|nr:hypothetical protein [Melioribacteraceae bacterium]MCF8263135.1 hypothetical protein [Melioribacteraceae bacterium]MCF8430365.1 hypothetical protein [Melioribacteraceae bacterium]
METVNHFDFLGAIVAIINNLLLIGIFIARIYKKERIEYWLGLIFILTIIPLLIMFINALAANRPFLYFLQLGLIIVFVILELLLDYILKIDFRHDFKIVIPYLILFYASFGGMIGIATYAGKLWSVLAIIGFLVMTAISLLMHFKTNE